MTEAVRSLVFDAHEAASARAPVVNDDGSLAPVFARWQHAYGQDMDALRQDVAQDWSVRHAWWLARLSEFACFVTALILAALVGAVWFRARCAGFACGAREFAALSAVVFLSGAVCAAAFMVLLSGRVGWWLGRRFAPGLVIWWLISARRDRLVGASGPTIPAWLWRQALVACKTAASADALRLDILKGRGGLCRLDLELVVSLAGRPGVDGAPFEVARCTEAVMGLQALCAAGVRPAERVHRAVKGRANKR